MSYSLKNKCAIVGVGETEIGKRPGKTAVDLQVEAIRLALQDAGLTLRDIDGLMTPELRLNPYWTLAPILAEYLGMKIPVAVTWPWGGVSGPGFIVYASAMISMGLCNTVLLVAGEPLRTGQGERRQMLALEKGSTHPDFEMPYGPLIPSLFALYARRHMHEYGTTSEQLAEVAVTFRKHALLHPRAQMRDQGPITVEDVLKSPMISSPLHQLDCSIVSDAAFAIIITSAERAKDLKQKPVYLAGAGESHQYLHVTCGRDLTENPGLTEAAQAAYNMAGVGLDDINVLGLHDGTTMQILWELEGLGFCKKGEAGPFVQEGRLAIGGALPTNTHGGCLSHSHAGRTVNFPHIIEVVRQLRGQAGARQVPNAHVGLTYFGAFYASHCVIILTN